jgi:catechol 2,3-dioxygenase-like lactoylglutathione lyase family enzyme
MSLFKQFTHVSVTVTDVAKAREFYSDTLGLQEIRARRSTFPASGTASEATCSCTSS